MSDEHLHQTPSGEHVTKCEPHAGWGYLAQCSCGWKGHFKEDRREAQEQAREHCHAVLVEADPDAWACPHCGYRNPRTIPDCAGCDREGVRPYDPDIEADRRAGERDRFAQPYMEDR